MESRVMINNEIRPARTRINLSHLEPSKMDVFTEIVARVLAIYLIAFGAYVIWSNYLK